VSERLKAKLLVIQHNKKSNINDPTITLGVFIACMKVLLLESRAYGKKMIVNPVRNAVVEVDNPKNSKKLLTDTIIKT
jgi:hypothetical protein